MTASTETRAHDLYHPQTKTTISFKAYTSYDGEAEVSVNANTPATKSWSTRSCTPAEAREIWKAWLKVGAVDLRKSAVIDGRVYKREANGCVSSGLLCTRYDDVDFDKYAPAGFEYDRHEDGGRDEYMSSKEVSYRIYFKPVAA